MADPVAEKSGFLKMYMSNHPDTLVAYAKYYGKVDEPIKSAEMSAIDTTVSHSSLVPPLVHSLTWPEHDFELRNEERRSDASARRH